MCWVGGRDDVVGKDEGGKQWFLDLARGREGKGKGSVLV